MCLLCSCRPILCYIGKFLIIINEKCTIRNLLQELTNFTSTCALEIVNKEGKLSELRWWHTNSVIINIVVFERHYGPVYEDKRVFCLIYYICLNVTPYSEHFKFRYFPQILFLTMPVKISTIFKQRPFSNTARVEKYVVVWIQLLKGIMRKKNLRQIVNAIWIGKM